MILLYATPLSGNAHKVRMALAFLGLPWTEQPTDAAARGSDAFATINPMGQIPVYAEGALCLRDSQAILAYLAARHRPGEWDGEDAEERGAIALWLSHAANEIANGPAALRLARRFGAAIAEDQAQAVTQRFLHRNASRAASLAGRRPADDRRPCGKPLSRACRRSRHRPCRLAGNRRMDPADRRAARLSGDARLARILGRTTPSRGVCRCPM
jgi:glutathione S-transferase